jgi:type I restriction enzyme S subunit
MNGRYLLGVLNSERVRRRWNATCNTSSGLNTINRRGLRKLLIPKPLSNEQCEIAELLIAADTAIAACEQEVTAVKRMKQSLLQNLLTGKVRVKLE